MEPTTFIDSGSGPQLANSRITVYDVIPYLEGGASPNSLAFLLGLTRAEFQTLLQYIEEHNEEVMAVHRQIEERIAQGNPPEIVAKLKTSHAKLLALKTEWEGKTTRPEIKVQALLADYNLQDQACELLRILEGPTWHDVWTSLNLELRTFRDHGLAPQTVDAELWEVCQKEELLFITAKRDAGDPDSLEAILRAKGAADSLPVFTLADPKQVMQSRAYTERAVERLLDYLIDIDNYRGTGRLFLP